MGYQMSLVSVQGSLCPGSLCRETPLELEKWVICILLFIMSFQNKIDVDYFECSDWSPLGFYGNRLLSLIIT